MSQDLDERFPQIAWDRSGLVSEYDFMQRYSRQHRYDSSAPNTNHALCGTRIRWTCIASGDSTRCNRCDQLAERRMA